jgi:hypothetical protein
MQPGSFVFSHGENCEEREAREEPEKAAAEEDPSTSSGQAATPKKEGQPRICADGKRYRRGGFVKSFPNILLAMFGLLITL